MNKPMETESVTKVKDTKLKNKKVKRLKDYLNSGEIFQIMKLKVLFKELAYVVDNWGQRGNLSPEEQKAFKTSVTWGNKGIDSIEGRLNDNSLKNLDNRLNTMNIRLEDDYTMKQVNKRNQDLMDNRCKAEQHLFDLAEITMYMNCKDCTNYYATCELGHFFENNFIHEPYMEQDWEGKHCKYAYRL